MVEVVRAEEQLVDPLQEQARLGALDDAVVVGGADRDDLRHAEVGQRDRVGGLALGRVVERPHADDDALAGHQPRHGLDGADRAGVGEGDRGPAEVVGGELVGPDLADQVLVGAPEGPEVERVGVADDRDHERAAAVALLDVDGEAQADVLVAHDPGLALGVVHVARVHDRHGVGDRPDHGVADEVGEADLPAAGAAEVAVDDPPVDLEQLGRHQAEAGGGGDLEAGLHVADDPGRGPPDGLALGRRGGRRRGGGGSGGRTALPEPAVGSEGAAAAAGAAGTAGAAGAEASASRR